jgi:hypothetical protein
MEKMRLMRHGDGADGGMMEEDQDMDGVLDYEEVKGKVSLWVRKPDVIKWIRKIFTLFLRNYKDTDSGRHVYEDRIHEMCSNNK